MHQPVKKNLISVRLFKRSLSLQVCQLLHTLFHEWDKIRMVVQEYIVFGDVCVVVYYLYRNYLNYIRYDRLKDSKFHRHDSNIPNMT